MPDFQMENEEMPGGPPRATVLVADDEEAVRDVVRQVLERNQFSVRDASNGREVLDQMERGSIDLVILDLVMPEVEGIETLRALRAAQPGLKILAMSGAFGGSFLEFAKRLGANAALKKPFSCEVLLQSVLALLNSRPPD